MSRLRYGVAALAAATILISGCSGSLSSTGGAADSGAAQVAQAAPPEAQAAGPDEKSVADAAAGAGKSTSGGTDAAGRQRAPIPAETAQRAVIYTAALTVRAKDVAAAADRAKAIVTGAGGYVSEERSSSFAHGEQAVVTFKVEAARYPDVLAQLGRDLGKRQSVRQDAQDVTEEVADVDSRVKSAKATLDQFRTLLSKAGKIGEILEIEREISGREADLEALQARQRSLAAQTALATVTLTVLPEATATPKPKQPSSGFLSGLRGGWRALVNSTEVALTVLGALLPWLLIVGVVWLAVLLTTRRLRRRAAPAPADTPYADTPRPDTPAVVPVAPSHTEPD
ncbi:DUF4349 domain-containing protein [Microbispora sp. RL4-1S]|uniref:DUF4349 domain-containing protein n=1 Tax=Microbispora oryzae TaxID=2806554 RepID=A0A940WQG7_9ACTN|nr:DUF4349 domain-containing protein [Microbispora oryzae]MBP2705645.1 DUF4349 domain-containing protein [Microbispora oryzae]